MSVELGEFVTAALVQIADGLRNANQRLAELEPVAETRSREANLGPEDVLFIAPEQPLAFELAYGENRAEGKGVHFDVAVTAESSKSGEGGAKFGIGVVSASAGGDASKSESRVSRVQFSVRVSDRVSTTGQEKKKSRLEEAEEVMSRLR